MVDFLLGQAPAFEVLGERAQENTLAAPHLLDAEVGQVMRRFVHHGIISVRRAEDALDDFAQLSLARYAHTPLLQRALELRDNVSFYDALYLVLAEAVEGQLLTRDAALLHVPGCDAEVELLG
ncbi:MAG: type II toxin-antitoxin system VapC family toxin [Deltaproteobacteria bacterium]|nr:type II toxin-antitoxin system VapC family toxin [Deltaproteobacteria bacterium]